MKTLIDSRESRRGAALVYAAIISVALAGLAMAILTMNLQTERVRMHTQDSQRAFYAAEAGLSEAYMQLSEDIVDPDPAQTVFVGTEVAPYLLGNTSYWASIDVIDSRSYTIVSTGTDGRETQRLELVLSEAPTGFFQYAAFGSEGVVLDSNSFIDSYDSALGSYASQVQGGNEFARENGHVGSNADILMKSNTEVHGDCRPGVTGTLDDSAPGVYISGSTDNLEEPFPMPPIVVPSFPTSGSLVGTSDVTLGPGDVHYDSILMKGGTQLTIVGPATVVIDDFEMLSNSDLNFETTNGPVVVHGTADFELQSNSTVTTNSDSATDVTLMLSGNNMTKNPKDSLKLGSNADFIGAIYAPNAEFSLNSNFNVYGSIICGFLDLSSFGQIHFDEALLYDGFGSSDIYEPALWRELPQQ